MTGLVTIAIGAFVAVNLLTILCFWLDKQRAIAGQRRISEGDLLGLAIFGGSLGALLARKLFRHKTQKEPFSTKLFVIIALQLGAIIGLAISFD